MTTKTPRLLGACTAFALAFQIYGAAQAAAQETAKMKQSPPPPQPAKEVHFPEFEQKTLANGLRVVVIEHRETPTVTVDMLFRAGQAFDTPAKAGLAAATAGLLRQGTTSRSAQEIAQAIDSVGGNLSTEGSLDSAIASLQVTSDQLALGLDLLADVVLRPSFPAEEVERWRRQVLNGLQVQQEDGEYLASAAFNRAVFEGHSYGLPAEGTPDSVRALTRDDLVAFHREYYVPNETILAVVGDVKAADAFAQVERAFGAWPRGKEHQIAAIEPAKRDKHRIVVVDMPNAVQTQISVGQIGLAFTDPDYFKADVYSAILGGGSSSRLYNEVRNKRGLSYGVSSYFVKAIRPGVFGISTFTKTETTVQTVEVILETVRELEKTPVPAPELEGRKTYLSGVFPLQIETPQGISNKLLEALKYGLGRDFIESYRGRIDAVTADQVRTFAEQRIHPEAALIVLAGNASGFLPELQKKLGPAEVIPYKELDLLRADLRQEKKPEAKPAG